MPAKVEGATDHRDKAKRKRKATDDGSDLVEASIELGDNSPPLTTKKKKRKHREASELDAANLSPPRVDARKMKENAVNQIEDAEGDPAQQFKVKKKKHKTSQAAEQSDPPRSTLPDPEGDEALSDQARKALKYAFIQYSDSSNWKFNKARQNWLMRNVWSAQAIPEIYIPLVIRYFSSVQGGTRDTLVKSCQTTLTSAASLPPSGTSPAVGAGKETSRTTEHEMQAQRARAILVALS